MNPSIYLINPAPDYPAPWSGEVFSTINIKRTLVADLATTTVAALIPQDFEVEICDETIQSVDFNHHAEWIAITGKNTQHQRIIEIAKEFRHRGKKIIIGGPYASLSPSKLQPYCDVLVCGELEPIATELFSDIRAGKTKARYIGDRQSVLTSSKPRWDLYPNDAALLGCVQTSRGCPFECEFCDVIQYLGRKQRHKPISQVLEELDVLHSFGYRSIFLADDNFTAHRSRCKELLSALAWWRRNHDVNFFTQVSIDAAKDDELLDLCFQAGIRHVFIGIETTNQASLKETKKRQNLNVDMNVALLKFVNRGIAVSGGMIVGFDSDSHDIFKMQYDFAMSTPIPIYTISPLTAMDSTPLLDRITREGRLVSESDQYQQRNPWLSNIMPKQMTAQEFQEGMRWLCNSLYEPSAFGERMHHLIDDFGSIQLEDPNINAGSKKFRPIESELYKIAQNVRYMGEIELKMWDGVMKRVIKEKPSMGHLMMYLMYLYAQTRHVFSSANYWDDKKNGTGF